MTLACRLQVVEQAQKQFKADKSASAALVTDSRGAFRVRTPLFYMKNDVMHTVIYAAFCMLPSLDLQDCTSF